MSTTTFKAPSSVSDGLARAMKLLKAGFIKNRFCDSLIPRDATCYCTDGALRAAFYGSAHSDKNGKLIRKARALVVSAIRASGQKHGRGSYQHTIFSWNDAKERTVKEVLKVLRVARVAAQLEGA